jgi:hypothetical protein
VRLVISPEITIGAIVSQRNSQEEARKAFVAHLELLKDLFELRIVLIWLTQYSSTDYSINTAHHNTVILITVSILDTKQAHGQDQTRTTSVHPWPRSNAHNKRALAERIERAFRGHVDWQS